MFQKRKCSIGELPPCGSTNHPWYPVTCNCTLNSSPPRPPLTQFRLPDKFAQAAPALVTPPGGDSQNYPKSSQKSRKQEILNLLACAVSSTDTL